MDIEQLINRHKNAVYRQMVRVCGNHDDAEDALANAILSALRASEQLEDPGSFQGWLAKIGTRACARMRVRNRLVQVSSLSDLEAKGFEFADDHATVERDVEVATLKDCVRGAVDLLTPKYREVYVRREIFGERAETVAKDLGLSLPALKSRLHRARALVREALDSGLGCKDLDLGR